MTDAPAKKVRRYIGKANAQGKRPADGRANGSPERITRAQAPAVW